MGHIIKAEDTFPKKTLLSCALLTAITLILLGVYSYNVYKQITLAAVDAQYILINSIIIATAFITLISLLALSLSKIISWKISSEKSNIYTYENDNSSQQVVNKIKQSIDESINDNLVSFDNKKILLVDDDKRNIFALSRVLKGRNIQVYSAEDGKKALEILSNHPDIDIILMDIMMPVMNGYEAIEKIRKQEKFDKLPVLAVTAKTLRSDQEKCMAVGANDYLPKPIDKDKLYSMMDKWLTKAA